MKEEEKVSEISHRDFSALTLRPFLVPRKRGQGAEAVFLASVLPRQLRRANETAVDLRGNSVNISLYQTQVNT